MCSLVDSNSKANKTAPNYYGCFCSHWKIGIRNSGRLQIKSQCTQEIRAFKPQAGIARESGGSLLRKTGHRLSYSSLFMLSFLSLMHENFIQGKSIMF